MHRDDAVDIVSIGQWDRTHDSHYRFCSFQPLREIANHCRQFPPMHLLCVDRKRVEPSLDSGFGETKSKPSPSPEVMRGLDRLDSKQAFRPVRTTGNSGHLGIPAMLLHKTADGVVAALVSMLITKPLEETLPLSLE